MQAQPAGGHGRMGEDDRTGFEQLSRLTRANGPRAGAVCHRRPAARQDNEGGGQIEGGGGRVHTGVGSLSRAETEREHWRADLLGRRHGRSHPSQERKALAPLGRV